ncbi:MAG: CBS domain-containing protein [Candidatus Marinimicrobia bacterium]|nr:CBS domain-containing protein [Candidatus Neomarinimicrobiota bacterium]
MDADLTKPKKGFGALILSDTIEKLEPPEPLIVKPDSTVKEAVELMIKHGHGSVLVVDSEELVGIFTERDLLKRVVRTRLDVNTNKISEVMTSEPQSLSGSDSIAYALNRMAVHSIRHIPIITDSKVSGFISVRGMLKYISEHTLER